MNFIQALLARWIQQNSNFLDKITKWAFTRVIGTLLSFVQGIRIETRLHHALSKVNQLGSSNKLVSTFSSSSRLVRSPSPLSVLRLILSGDRFLTNLFVKVFKKVNKVSQAVKQAVKLTWTSAL